MPTDSLNPHSTFRSRVLSARTFATLAPAAVAVLALWPTWPLLNHHWAESTAYAHGYLVAAVALGWLIFNASRVPAIQASPAIWPTVLLAGVILTWMLAWKANNAMIQQLLAPIVIWLAMASAMGFTAAKRVAAPIAYLYFAIPIWDQLIPLLQNITILASETLLAWIGVPAVITNTIVTIPEGWFEIAESCSGVAYLMVSLALATLFILLNDMRGKRAVMFIIISAALALVANWIRVITVIYAGHVTQMRHYFVAREHGSLGWFIYIVLLLVIYWVGSRLLTDHEPEAKTATTDTDSPIAPSRHALARALLVLAVPLVAVTYVNASTPPTTRGIIQMPTLGSHGVAGPIKSSAAWMPEFEGASAQTRAAYDIDGTRIEVFVAEYSSQRQGAELVGGNNTLIGATWFTEPAARSGSSLPAGSETRAIVARTPSGERWVVNFVYRIDTFATSSGTLAQLAYGVLSWRGEKPSRVVAIAAKCLNSCSETQREISRAWEKLSASLIAAPVAPPARVMH